MEQVGCKECTSTDCHGCNLLRLEQMLKSGKLDALMDDKRGIKTGIDVRPVVLCGVCELHGHCYTEDVFAFVRLSEENRFCAVGKVKTNGEGGKKADET